jgi:hypothetical protein
MAIDAAVWGQCRQALDNLLRYAERDKFAEPLSAIGAAHLASAYAALGEDGGFEELTDLVGEDVVAAVMDDASLDFAVRADPRGRTLIDRYLDERGAREPPAGREFLRALKASRVGVFEVLSEGAGGELALRDVLEEGATFHVASDPDLDPLEPGEVVGARLTPFRGRFCFAGGVWSLAPHVLDGLRSAWAGEGAEEFVADAEVADVSADELRAGVRENLAAMISTMVIQQELAMTASDEDGEPYDPTRVSWDVADEDAAAARLDALPECGRWPEKADDDPPIWSWLDLEAVEDLDEEEKANADYLLGTIRLGAGKLELFVSTASLAEEGRALLEEALAGLLGEGRAEPFSMERALAEE